MQVFLTPLKKTSFQHLIFFTLKDNYLKWNLMLKLLVTYKNQTPKSIFMGQLIFPALKLNWMKTIYFKFTSKSQKTL